MKNNVRDILLIFATIITVSQHTAFASRSCRCLPTSPQCWPSTSEWQAFNTTVNGRLLTPRSSAAACTKNYFNEALCYETYTHWTDSSWRSDQVGAMQYFNWENASCSISNFNISCVQGSVPVYAVNATQVEHVQATVAYASNKNLRLVMKTTGHDLLGRSTAFGSLLLWLHHMKNMTFIPQYRTCAGSNISNVIRLGAGVQWGDVYTWLAPNGLTVLGGTSKSVAATGGYMQGGGHSPLSRWAGMPTDQVLEYDVIIANGTRLTASPCQNSDLFWALSGGGAGTYGVVVSAVLKTFPSPSIVGAMMTVEASNETRYALLIRDFFRILKNLADQGWSGYFTMSDLQLTVSLLLPNGNLSTANTTFTQFIMNNADLSFTSTAIGQMPSFYYFYENVLVGRDPTGYNGIVGSRLIPETIFRNQTDAVSGIFVRIKGQQASFSQLTISLVGGGEASRSTGADNSVNPLWRTAALHVFYGQGWSDNAPQSERQAAIDKVNAQTKILDTLSNSTLFGCYMNEANPYEQRWQERFFGSYDRYNRLKSIKQKYDPLGLFVCPNCVGSDDWTSDLNCPLTASSHLTKGTISTIILISLAQLIRL